MKQRKPYLKQVIVINDDLKMSPGKIASQAAHAAVGAAFNTARADAVQDWMHAPTKIVLRASARQMLGVIKRAKRRGVRVYKFVDAAPTTENTENKMTALAIGPLMSNKFANITGHLELY